ncbi:MAG: bile acid:sodium symporter [Pseudomonadota bacterium]
MTLIVMMATLGLTLTLDEFRKVLAAPRALFIGLFAQIVMLPLVAVGIVWLIDPLFAIGMGIIILACCPSAATSNFFSYLARGDLALSVSLTAVSAIVVLVTTPIFINFGFWLVTGEGQDISLPVIPAMQQILILIVLPLSVGMGLRAYSRELAMAIEPYATRLAFATILFLMAVLFAEVYPDLSFLLKTTLLPVATLNVIMMMMGYLLATLFKLAKAQARTITVEAGIQNYILAVVISISILQRPDFALAAIVYLFTMYICVFSFIALSRFQDRRDKQQ